MKDGSLYLGRGQSVAKLDHENLYLDEEIPS